MGNFVSTHAKSYKQSQVGKLQAHEERKQLYDVNVFPDLTVENRSHSFAEYGALEERMIEAKKAAGVRPSNLKFRKDANVIFSNVVALSREQVDALKTEFPDTWKDKIMDSAKAFSDSVKAKFGFEPLSIHLHLDEGHVKDDVFLPNVHMHINFFNFDFKNLTQPQRTMRCYHFSKLQDMAGNAFSDLGFKRGRRDYLRDRKHLEKGEYIHKKFAEVEAETKEARSKLTEIQHTIFNSKEELAVIEEDSAEAVVCGQFAQRELDDLSSKRETLIAELSRLEIVMGEKKKELSKEMAQAKLEYQKKIDSMNNVLDKRVELVEKSKQRLKELTSEVEKLEQDELSKQGAIDSLEYRILRSQQKLKSTELKRSRIASEADELEKRVLAAKSPKNARETILERQNTDLTNELQEYKARFGELPRKDLYDISIDDPDFNNGLF